MANIGTWDTAVPTDAANASTGDDALRSIKTQLRIGLEESFYWRTNASSTSSSGYMLLGTARPASFEGISIATNKDGTTLISWFGAVGVTESGPSLWHQGSTVTQHLGAWSMLHARPLSHRPAWGDPSSTATADMLNPQSAWSARWFMQSGRTYGPGGLGDSNKTVAITFPIAYEVAPHCVQVRMLTPNEGGLLPDTRMCSILSGSVTSTGFTSLISNTNDRAGVSTGWLAWYSIGTLPNSRLT